jgi:type I restriction enzyme, S subunit
MTDRDSTIPKGWRETTLGENLDDKGYIRGPFGSALKRGEMKDNGIPVYEQQNAIYNHREFRYFIDQDKYNELRRFTVKPKDIVISCSGTLGKTTVIDETDPVGIISQALLILRVNSSQLSFSYLNYFLNSREGQGKLLGASHGSVQVNIAKRSEVENISLLLPPLPEQCAIVAVLSSLDDKIEHLRQQNITLESTTQTIFKEWFVNFKFPGATGKMGASPLGEIPSGWRFGHLTEMLDFMEGPGIRNWQYTNSGRRFINIRLIKDGDINIKDSNFISEEEAEKKYKHFHLQERDMVVSTSGTLGRCAIVRKEHLPLMLNTSVILFRPIDGRSYGFMYQYLKSNIFKNELESLASGSVQLNFGPVHLKQIEMMIPPKDVLQKFAEAVNPLYQKISFNLSQIETLATLRDTLLPKLMKGEVRVKGFSD